MRIHKFFQSLARICALFGGTVLGLLILITCISILGRTANSILNSDLLMGVMPGLAQGLIDLGVGPIPGDFELVEAGMAFVIFAFIPLTQISAGHASVDIFTNGLSGRPYRVLRFLIEALFAVVLVTIAVQLEQGMARFLSSGQTTLMLQFPVWWSYAASFAAACVAAAIGVYMALVRLYELLTDHEIAPEEGGADH